MPSSNADDNLVLLQALTSVGVVLAFLWGLSAIVLALRVGWLRDIGRAPRAPKTGRLLLGAVWGFVFSNQHKDIADRPTSFLVLASRLLIVSTAFLMISAFALISADATSTSGPPAPQPTLDTPAPAGSHEESDAFQRNALVLDALATGRVQTIVAHASANMRNPEEIDVLRTAAKAIPPQAWTSSFMLEHKRTFPEGIVVVSMSVKYDYPSSRSVILDTTFRYSSSVPELVQMDVRPGS